MKKVRRTGTSAEMELRRALHARGLRYRVDTPVLADKRRRVDIAFSSARVAVFVDGCFWHGCPEHATWPAKNADFWRQKIEANQRRDRDTDAQLREAGWQVTRVWEHEDPEPAASRIETLVRAARARADLRAPSSASRFSLREVMHGPEILVASMSVPQPRGKSKEPWQYHSRSDLHSKVACWGVFFDMLRTSALLGEHARAGKVIFGVNFEMRDYATGRKKNLDLVIARPSGEEATGHRTLADLAGQWGIVLNSPQAAELAELPLMTEGALAGSGVLVALEAKAAMTAHSKARPRLYDELNSSHLTVHGASNQALAVGLVMVNESDTFISPERQTGDHRDVVSQHLQPADAERIIRKVEEIPRRASPAHHGFDGLGIVVVRAANDGSPVRLMARPPAPQPGEVFYYDDMLSRVANEYDTRFSSI